MARTKRSVPHHADPNWVPSWNNPRGMTEAEKYERGLVKHEISADYKAGQYDNWSTQTTGGKSTRRVKQTVNQKRRRHEQREAREQIQDDAWLESWGISDPQ